MSARYGKLLEFPPRIPSSDPRNPRVIPCVCQVWKNREFFPVNCVFPTLAAEMPQTTGFFPCFPTSCSNAPSSWIFLPPILGLLDFPGVPVPLVAVLRGGQPLPADPRGHAAPPVPLLPQGVQERQRLPAALHEAPGEPEFPEKTGIPWGKMGCWGC